MRLQEWGPKLIGLVSIKRDPRCVYAQRKATWGHRERGSCLHLGLLASRTAWNSLVSFKPPHKRYFVIAKQPGYQVWCQLIRVELFLRVYGLKPICLAYGSKGGTCPISGISPYGEVEMDSRENWDLCWMSLRIDKGIRVRSALQSNSVIACLNGSHVGGRRFWHGLQSSLVKKQWPLIHSVHGWQGCLVIFVVIFVVLYEPVPNMVTVFPCLTITDVQVGTSQSSNKGQVSTILFLYWGILRSIHPEMGTVTRMGKVWSTGSSYVRFYKALS
jgi:hypothetical protein